ncbi:MAG: glycoside hydrolase family 99-like domain-containing protein [Methanobacteriaceae archaeon]
MFNETFYLNNYPDVKKSGMDPIIHYLYYGYLEERIPSENFDGNFYMKTYESVKKANINPLAHYLLYGAIEGKKLKEDIIRDEHISNIFDDCDNKSSEFVPYDENFIIDLKEEDVKLIALYLPQFHTIPENDEWWEKGFTEWTNVTKAIPRFLDHYQPHLPIDLGFYNLENLETHIEQANMAKKYGIHGFCYYYYWFNGKKLLDKPLELVLEHPEIDFPFCIFWANESWSRRWDGSENEILIQQKNSPEDDINFIKDLSRFFKDERYIKVDGKFLIVVYKPFLLPNANETFKRWREYCRAECIGELLITCVKFGDKAYEFESEIDALMEFPPVFPSPRPILKEGIEFINKSDKIRFFDTEKFIKSRNYFYNEDPFLTFKGIFTSWDNTPRRNGEGWLYRSTPNLYKEWLLEIINFTKKNRNPEEQIIFINAWNEWAEGAHLEPDRKYGYAFLKATADTILKSRK